MTDKPGADDETLRGEAGGVRQPDKPDAVEGIEDLLVDEDDDPLAYDVCVALNPIMSGIFAHELTETMLAKLAVPLDSLAAR